MNLEICRVCRQSSDDLVSIDALLHEESDLSILESITVCSGSEISKSDGLPYFICDFCLDELKITYIFLQKLQESTEILTNQLRLGLFPQVKAESAGSDIKDEDASSQDESADDADDNQKTESSDTTIPEDGTQQQEEEEEIYTFEYNSDQENNTKSESEELNVVEAEEHIQNYEVQVDEPEESDFMEEETLIEEYQVEYTDEPDFSSGVFEELEVATEEEVNLIIPKQEKIFYEESNYVKQVRGGYLLKLNDGTQVYQCDSCEKTFKKPDYLSNHVRFVHKKVRPFGCSVCSNTYTSSLRLKEHFRTHTGEKPFTCQYCDQSFARNVTLKTHMRTHTREAPYKCKICSKSFRQDATLRGHMFVHTGIGVPCEICNKMFARAVDVKKHMSVHDENKKRKSKDE